ncbi:hypothetical protein [Photobacterium sanguinicancri]|uniref:hypothetical protein n=1 Tax=Photobacterium sanguinicancri TaxID=875932 RepID=UPI0026E287FA|nr:hypothetical protein [Photobacterium sanguinicancri]MDO6497317.1 hypothetical protein [Photobacterium sanguinicancri]
MKSESDRIFPQDLASIGLCCAGGREVFEAYGLSWNEFVKAGADCNELLQVGDPIITEAVRRFRKRNGQ